MKSAVLFNVILLALFAASNCQPPPPQHCPLWCRQGALPGSVCAQGCVCGQHYIPGLNNQLPCNPMPFGGQPPSPPRPRSPSPNHRRPRPPPRQGQRHTAPAAK
uniref:Putative secreted protein n=1 Tax=Amblyomma triste TaxID=251400 RepID=A0A023G1I1_AMBTT